MTIYKAQDLERIFKQAGNIRKRKKQYENDAGYWDGGQCNWGANHSLKGDCETLARSLNKMQSLREIKEELKQCTNKQEYDAKKDNFIRKCQECLTGLQNHTENSSMFGICIIWQDKATNKNVISKIEVCRTGLTKLKEQLEKENYQWVKEIKALRLEQKQIEKKLRDNKQKALSKDIDPAEKALLMQLIEEDGKILKANLEKQKDIDKKFNFEPDKYVDDLITSMKNAVNKSNHWESRTSRSANDNPNNSDSESDYSESDDEDEINDDEPKPKNNLLNWIQENKPTVIFFSLVSVIGFYIYNQHDEE